MEAKSLYLVICEGSSEYAYIQELNRFLNERGHALVFNAVNAHGGGIDGIRRLCRDRRIRANGRALVMADGDIYADATGLNGRRYLKWRDRLPRFLFQYQNFEDFLLMHYPQTVLDAWRREVEPKRHFVTPLVAREYEDVFRGFIRAHEDELRFGDDYQKGDMPFSLDEGKLANLFANDSETGFPRSDFARFLRGEALSEAREVW